MFNHPPRTLQEALETAFLKPRPRPAAPPSAQAPRQQPQPHQQQQQLPRRPSSPGAHDAPTSSPG